MSPYLGSVFPLLKEVTYMTSEVLFNRKLRDVCRLAELMKERYC